MLCKNMGLLQEIEDLQLFSYTVAFRRFSSFLFYPRL